jgi:hypothetical protein
MKKQLLPALFALLIAGHANGFEIIQESNVTEVGAAFVIDIGGETYALTEIPISAPMIKTSLSEPDEAKGSGVTIGCKTTETEAIAVLEAWYRKYSYDFDSIKIRNLSVGKQQYIVWCSNPLFMLCSTWEIRAGTWVEYEVSGKNLHGGRTAFSREIRAIRKNQKNGNCQE